MFLLNLIAIGSFPVLLVAALPGDWTLGQATYHYFSGTTACGIPNSDQYLLSHSASFPYGFIAAMSEDTFNGGTGCGGCFEIQCLGPWSATNTDCTCNPSVSSITIQAVDLSGTFSPPHFDISNNAWDTFTHTCGAINITFREVSCPFTQNIQIITLQNDAWWFGLRIENVGGYGQVCTMGIKSSESSEYMSCNNQGSQWFCDDASLEPTALPITLQLQTCDGVELIAADVITAYGIHTFDFGSNFPFVSGTNSPTQSTSAPHTNAPTVTRSVSPSQSPVVVTPSPVGETSNGNIFVHNFGNSLSVWWYVAYLTGVRSGYAVEKFEIQSMGSVVWYECTAVAVIVTEYQCQALADAYVFPLSVRLTSRDGEVIVANGLITEYTGDMVFDFGDNFGMTLEPSVSPSTAPTAVPFTSTENSASTTIDGVNVESFGMRANFFYAMLFNVIVIVFLFV
eukprot:88982_1